MARSMRCSSSLPHSVTIACFSWLIVVNPDLDRPSVEGHPKQRHRLDLSPGCLGATMWSSTNVKFSRRRYVCVCVCVTVRSPAADIRVRCQRYSCRMWQLLWTITETINTLFLVVDLLTCVMCCYRSRLVFNCCFYSNLETLYKVGPRTSLSVCSNTDTDKWN